MKLSSDQHPDLRAYTGIVLGVSMVSSAAILIRLAQGEGLVSLQIAAWRLTLATLILAPVVLITGWRELRSLTLRDLGAVLAAGAFLALHFASWIQSLAMTTVAASVVLVLTSPLFVALASTLLLGEALGRRVVLALVVSMVGSVLIGVGDLGKGSHQFLGDLLAVVGAIAAAGYFIIGRRLRARLSLLTYVVPVYGTAAVLLMGILAFTDVSIVSHTPRGWLWLLLLAIGPQILGHSSLNWALRYFSATYVTLATLAEPVVSTLLAWWVLGEIPSLWALGGGGLILAGIVLASRAERPQQRR